MRSLFSRERDTKRAISEAHGAQSPNRQTSEATPERKQRAGVASQPKTHNVYSKADQSNQTAKDSSLTRAVKKFRQLVQSVIGKIVDDLSVVVDSVMFVFI